MKVSRPVIYTLLLAVVVAAFVFTSEEPQAKKSKGKDVAARPKAKGEEQFTPEDFNAKFPPLNMSAKNAFMPGVVRMASRGMSGLPPSPDAVPAELAGGDPNWVYTGTAVLDGVPTALLENRVTLEAEFVRQGDVWKRATISRIAPDSVTLSAANGKAFTLMMPTELPDPTAEAMGNLPVRPLPGGPIGGQPSAPPANLQVQPTPQPAPPVRP